MAKILDSLFIRSESHDLMMLKIAELEQEFLKVITAQLSEQQVI
jgi:hypothetical protein